jgi:drug/metabolite transporter (DMT)-like permease
VNTGIRLIFGLQFAFLFGGMNLGVSAGLALLTLQLHSFMTIGLSACLLGERPSRFQIAGALLAFSGIGIVAANVGGDFSAAGLLAVVLAALSWAVGNVLSKRMGKVNMFALWSGAAWYCPLSMRRPMSRIPRRPGGSSWPSVSISRTAAMWQGRAFCSTCLARRCRCRAAEMLVSSMNLLRAGPVTIRSMEVVRRGEHDDGCMGDSEM